MCVHMEAGRGHCVSCCITFHRISLSQALSLSLRLAASKLHSPPVCCPQFWRCGFRRAWHSTLVLGSEFNSSCLLCQLSSSPSHSPAPAIISFVPQFEGTQSLEAEKACCQEKLTIATVGLWERMFAYSYIGQETERNRKQGQAGTPQA